jgi:hypothetical protein
VELELAISRTTRSGKMFDQLCRRFGVATAAAGPR